MCEAQCSSFLPTTFLYEYASRLVQPRQLDKHCGRCAMARGFQFLTGFQCGTHFSALWDGTYLKYCTISFPFLYGLVISDFLLDVWIL
ncbi:hypothetical protein K461DRAFT_275197 [Myriangium duriaei CBS 260.36]|uniref:Uncharacterized protein n=1 Tax=Myriangium duriaei CBS 260.36 TaxID=1168546 RepID=A0A9P4J6R6_9PEZI|nr:hypothetical protein K461DRAFT_275197 [Myriangium duriaei CBS 260.36]